MNLKERFKLFALGGIAGIFLVTLFFGKRMSCKDSIINYLPEGRVKQEILFYPFQYSTQASAQLNALNIDAALFKKQYIQEAEVDFDMSQQRAKPCGQYVLFSQDSVQKLKIQLEKCKDLVLIKQVDSAPIND